MPRLKSLLRWRMLPLGLLPAGLLAALTLGSGAGGQDDPRPGGKRFLGAGGCQQCHEQPNNRDTAFVQLNEWKKWKDEDKHSQAYTVLLTDRSKAMGKLVGIDDVTNPNDANNACIKCHAVPVAMNQQGRGFDLKDGVSCDACHGPSEAWVNEHWQNPKWREFTALDKGKFGMLDLRDPEVRSKRCYSCHVGDVAEGKVLTHAMYAAGHPPLPGIEVATFSEQEPRHWRHLRDVPYLQKASPEVQKKYNFDTAPFEQTRLALVGGAVALREAANLLADYARASTAAKDGRGEWPELTHFDCYACHHDLRDKSWRQERGYTGSPGRPQMRPWPNVLVKAGLRLLGGPDDQLAQQLKDLHAAFEAQPYGSAPRVTEGAKAVAAWADGQVKRLKEFKYDRAAALRALKAIADVAKDPNEYLDFDSARQAAWAARVIYGEVDPKPANDQDIQKVFGDLDQTLRLKLPSGTKTTILGEELDKTLGQINAHEPGTFRASMKRLRDLLGE